MPMIPPIGPTVKSLGMLGAPPMAQLSWISGGRGAAGELLHPNWLRCVSSHRLNMGAGNAFFVAITLALLIQVRTRKTANFTGTKLIAIMGCRPSRYGNSTYWNDGTSSQSYGNSTYNSDGTSSQTYGHTTYFSDGRSCQRIGNQIHCN
jgi:hypothetical protein